MIGDRIREERKRLGFSQEAFAAVAGITRRPYAEWEAGNTSPTATQLEAIAAAGADVLYIITGQRSFTPPPALAPDEAALLDNFRNSSKDAQEAIKATSAAFAQRKGRRSA